MSDQYKRLNSLKKSEYRIGAELCLKSAESHKNVAYNSAEALFEYGIAASHLVLSLEELAKASLLHLKSIDNKIKINELKELFQTHSIKHSVIEKITETLIGIYTEKIDFKKLSDKQRLALFGIVIVFMISLYLDKGKKKEEKFKGVSMDELKVMGFYVDYNRGVWESPERITKNMFDECKTNYEIIYSLIRNILFSATIDKNNVHQLVQQLDITDFYKKSLSKNIKDMSL